jgi:hypothetical protein
VYKKKGKIYPKHVQNYEPKVKEISRTAEKDTVKMEQALVREGIRGYTSQVLLKQELTDYWSGRHLLKKDGAS